LYFGKKWRILHECVSLWMPSSSVS
jgi:hypothetical protein